MSRTKRIQDRFPDFYRIWDDRSLIFKLVNSLGKRLDEADKDSDRILRSHWVGTAFREDLDKLGAIFNLERKPEESDSQYRSRLKRAIVEFKGGGTVSAVLTSVKTALGLPGDYPIQMVENPPVETSRTVEVRTGDTWVMSSNSVLDAVPGMTLSIETTDAKVTNPTISNLDTDEKITFNGVIESGQKLTVKDGKAMLDKTNVRNSMSTAKVPSLLRKGSTWSYAGEVEEEIGLMDRAKFDSSVFAIGIPMARLVFNWTACQPAAFEIQIPKDAIASKGDFSALRDVVGSVRAAGVEAMIKVV